MTHFFSFSLLCACMGGDIRILFCFYERYMGRMVFEGVGSRKKVPLHTRRRCILLDVEFKGKEEVPIPGAVAFFWI